MNLRYIRSAKMVSLAGALVVSLGLGGCAGGTKLVPVEGKVLVGGKTLTTGTVILYPDADKGNTSQDEPRGLIDAEGQYKVYTNYKEGAPPGWYKVAVTAQEVDPKNPYNVKWLHHDKYIRPERSGLTFEVKEKAAAGDYDLKLEPRK
jgi:hypothetical protein